MEILFKGQRKDNGEWVHGDLWQTHPDGVAIIQYPSKKLDHKEFNLEHHLIDPDSVDIMMISDTDYNRKMLVEFMEFISNTPFEELSLYSNEEIVDGYLKNG